MVDAILQHPPSLGQPERTTRLNDCAGYAIQIHQLERNTPVDACSNFYDATSGFETLISVHIDEESAERPHPVVIGSIRSRS